MECEKRGKCENCGSKKHLRWIRGEFYVCYECFVNDLQCEADVMVPMYRVTDMNDYMEEWEWDELWVCENENWLDECE